MRVTRSFLSVALALGLGLSAASCSSDKNTEGDTPKDNTQAATSFTHPQYEELTINLDEAPKRVVADFYAAGVLASYGIEPVGVFGWGSDSEDVLSAFDINKAEILGKGNEINVEKLVDLQPDVIVGHGSPEGWSWFKEDLNKQLLDVAPFIPLATTKSVETNIDDNLKIAAFLGADPESPEIKKSKEAFETAKTHVKDAVKGKDLEVLLGAPAEEVYYTAQGFPQNDLFEELGMKTVGKPRPAEGNPWGQLAWEEFPEFKADVVTTLPESSAPDLSQNALWSAHPAVKANQVFAWDQKLIYSYDAYADWLDATAKDLTTYQKLK